jgi:prepilin-type N-terminal cleavage/methylation domain-containing protein
MRRGGRQLAGDKSSIVNPSGFTLVELLVVVGVLALLLGVLVPALTQARRAARSLVGGYRQRQIVLAVNLYAADHGGWYPESVATAAMLGRTWRWEEPRMMKACEPRAAGYRCSMAGYLRAYLPKAVVLSCPSSPTPYPYLEAFWRAGEQWDNPDTDFTDDSVVGSFCFYWSYVGYLTEQEGPFRGPQTDDGRAGCSGLLVSDYFGFNHWRSPEAFGSCERLPHAEVTAETHGAPAYWFRPPQGPPDRAPTAQRSSGLGHLKLRAGFVDGHVESYRPDETTTLEVADALDGTTPAFSGLGLGAGQFYIPANAATVRP